MTGNSLHRVDLGAPDVALIITLTAQADLVAIEYQAYGAIEDELTFLRGLFFAEKVALECQAKGYGIEDAAIRFKGQPDFAAEHAILTVVHELQASVLQAQTAALFKTGKAA